MAPHRHGSAVIEFPNNLEIVITREFDAPIGLVFDVSTKPEHLRKTFAPSDEEVTECSIDLRVGGNYHIVFVDSDGAECSFRGTYLEVEPPTRTVQTWLFDGWPATEAVESIDLHEAGGVTTQTYRLAFRDRAGRDHMTTYDGLLASFDHQEDLLRSLLDRRQEAADQESVSATLTVAAPAAKVFAVLADPATHATIDGTGWVQAVLDPAPLTQAGQVFRMGMYHAGHPDGNYQVANRVEVFDPPRAIGWMTGQEMADGQLELGGWLWRYDLAPLGPSETEVTLTYDWSGVSQYIRDRGIQFPPFGPEHLINSLHHLAGVATGTHDKPS